VSLSDLEVALLASLFSENDPSIRLGLADKESREAAYLATQEPVIATSSVG
jgi:hypothetical protein